MDDLHLLAHTLLRLDRDGGVRHDLEDVAAEFGIAMADLDESKRPRRG
ncbi:hypothetical protein LX15_006224 [Streptoalloteichus tenebrarius]|uniref:Uncharacterized protein n=1 Tax=Streptoalloteichus tenebrarius (strain ATCC 17920 / DSM 40477 / JCM 4838 / CBS 697.72 / NBRC 16177 / NCIMB 11028 / NRRL B-12390 / A12253. 1 / ISP 5477) TaxID=1933 RepID=A0ABT1I3X4_STRSD|nr:hypothetical protein [Streptoalloteichus tenebrarius]MCP2262485.1 hypothetical protein [Streptoalloteichus tenebrarius]BFF01546.1 hypothetical protein GCM10020241_32210 [Streptoalloteichus tenebrarius]